MGGGQSPAPEVKPSPPQAIGAHSSGTMEAPGSCTQISRHTCPFPESRAVQRPPEFCFDFGTIHPKGIGQAKHNQKRSGSWQSCPPQAMGPPPRGNRGPVQPGHSRAEVTAAAVSHNTTLTSLQKAGKGTSHVQARGERDHLGGSACTAPPGTWPGVTPRQ